MSAELIRKEPKEYTDLSSVVIKGDLSVLSEKEKLEYYSSICSSLGLNPLTRPFEYIKLNGKITLYARKDCTEQLRSIKGVSLNIVAREIVSDVYVVTARATDKNGRIDESLGAVPVKGLHGEALANAFMKAETKAKRRVTLSIAGLGITDESEIGSIPNAVVVNERDIPVANNPSVNYATCVPVCSETMNEINKLVVSSGMDSEALNDLIKKGGASKLNDLTQTQADKFIDYLKKQLSKKGV